MNVFVDVTISTTKDHEYCGVLNYDTAWVTGESVKLLHVGEKDSNQAVRYRDTIRLIYIYII